jgi:hypothetical protein
VVRTISSNASATIDTRRKNDQTQGEILNVSELIKIAPNGQWILEKSTSRAYGMSSAPLGPEQPKVEGAPAAPRVKLFRGMNGLTAKDLKRFGVDVNPAGGIHHATEDVKLKDHGWWSDDPRWGMMYSAYDHVNKKPSHEPTYDVFMLGEADHPGDTGKNITHALREKNTPVTMHRVVYAPTRGDSKQREATLKGLLPDVVWPKPKSKP